MIVFLLERCVLIMALARNIRRDLQFRGLAFLLIILLAAGTVFYWRTENWSLLDSLYVCVMTMATVGYGDVVPTKDVSKLFTIG